MGCKMKGIMNGLQTSQKMSGMNEGGGPTVAAALDSTLKAS